MITHLVFEKDIDAYARDRDKIVIAAAKEAGVEVVMRSGRTLWDSDLPAEKNHRKPTMSISQVQAAGSKVGPIPRPIPAPQSFPDPGETHLNLEQDQASQEPDFNKGSRSHGDQSYEQLAGPNGDFAVPMIEELGFAATLSHRGGETIALECLDRIIADEKYTATVEKPKTAPTAFGPQATTLLSPHLHFGSLSIREFYWRVQGVVDRYIGRSSQPPFSPTGQLFFRDMYFGAQAALGHAFSQTMHNSHARFIPWHLPLQINHKTKQCTGSYHIDSPQAEEWFQCWKRGRTGLPWIDALMRQLRTEDAPSGPPRRRLLPGSPAPTSLKSGSSTTKPRAMPELAMALPHRLLRAILPRLLPGCVPAEVGRGEVRAQVCAGVEGLRCKVYL
jgi:cryptochrome